MPSSGYSKPDIATLKSIAPNARVDGSSWLVRQNKHNLPSWYTWIASDTSDADDDFVVVPVDNPSVGRWVCASASRVSDLRILSGDRTYYVSVLGGNDAFDGLTPQTSFATIQKFIDTVTSIDLNGWNVSCNVMPNTIEQSIFLKSVKTNGGLITINGVDATSTIIQVDGDCVSGRNIESPYCLSNLTFFSNNGSCVNLYKCSDVKIYNCNFALNNSSQIISFDSSVTVSDCDISGSALNFIDCSFSDIEVITPSGSRAIRSQIAYRDAFIKASASCITFNASYTGSVTGVRYKIRAQSVLDCLVPLANIPGNLPGIAETSQVFETNVGSIFLNGKIQWGDGNNEPDTNLYRESNSFLRTDNNFGVGGSILTNSVFGVFKTISDTDNAIVSYAPNYPYYVFRLTTSGKMMWGNSNGQFLADTFLYRDGINSLKTDGNFNVGGNLTVSGKNSATHIKDVIVDDTGISPGKVLKLNETGDRLIYADGLEFNRAIAISDEGEILTAAATSINFTGSGVTASSSNGAVTVDIPGATTGSVGISDASTKSKGIVQLAGDLGGQADSPLVVTNTTAKWNSDRIKDVIVDDSAKGAGKILGLNASGDRLIYVDPDAGTIRGSSSSFDVNSILTDKISGRVLLDDNGNVLIN